MEIIERTDLRRIHFLNTLTLSDIKKYYPRAKNDDVRRVELNKLKNFCACNIKTHGITTRIYSYSTSTYDYYSDKDYDYESRLYCGNSIQSLSCAIRGFLCNGLMTDIDMKNAHPVILLYICKLHKIQCPELTNYVFNRDRILYEYGGERDIAKTKFLKSMNDGHACNSREKKILKLFDSEMKMLQKLIPSQYYPDIYDSVPNDKKQINWCGSALNRVLCNYENKILTICHKYLTENNLNIAVPMFDGCMFYGDHYSNNQILEDITERVENEYNGLNMEWTYKSHQQVINMPEDFDIPQIRNLKDAEEENKNSFKILCEEFEKTHCKIINKSFFLKSDRGKDIIMTRPQIRMSYEHMNFTHISKKKDEIIEIQKPFIDEWFGYDKMRHYDDVGMYPTGLQCPDNHYNLWKDFDMELITEYKETPDAVKLFLNHIKILCGNDDIVADYIIKWIAQMIQYPAIKTMCPTFISKEGSGKGTLIQLISKMLGNEKVFETTKPSRDVWGDFNGLMGNAFLVNLNELSKKETVQSEGEIKGLITDPTLQINNKGISQYRIQSFHRFMITTNNEDPIKTQNDDRRNMIVKSSDELKGNREYFDKVYELLKDVNVIKSCYEYFKSIPNMDKFNNIPIPRVEYHNELKKLYRSPVEDWLYQLTEKNHDTKEITEILGSELFSMFKTWCKDNSMEYVMKIQSFGLKMKNLNINGIEKGRHTNKGELKLLDFQKMKQHFNIGCLIDYEDR